MYEWMRRSNRSIASRWAFTTACGSSSPAPTALTMSTAESHRAPSSVMGTAIVDRGTIPAMAGAQSLRTERLLLRRWRQSDREPFARLNSDPLVMEHLPSTLTRSDSDTFADRIETVSNNGAMGCGPLRL